jgi:hypothetical protein
MARRKRFAVLDFLMEAVCITALVAMLALMGFQSSTAMTFLSQQRSARQLADLKSTLERVAERQALHYLDSSEFAGSGDHLQVPSPSGVAIHLSASERGWSATAVHEELGRSRGCAVFFGAVTPPSGPVTPDAPGEVYCTQ